MKHQTEGTPAGSPDFRLHAPAAAKNRAAILGMIEQIATADATVLEIGSGSGEHAVYIGEHLPRITWQPSDPDPTMRASIMGWINHTRVTNVRPPLDIDCALEDWHGRVKPAPDLIVAINFAHIVPPAALDGLLAGAGRLLGPGGLLALYGPFRFNNDYTSNSNKSFDHMIHQQNPDWGLRDLNNIAVGGAPHGLELRDIIAMPSHNHTLVMRRL